MGKGIVNSLQGDNAKASCRIDIEGQAPAWMFDPQTSGGLIAGVQNAKADEIVRESHAAGYDEAAIVGEVFAIEAGRRAGDPFGDLPVVSNQI